MPYWKVGDNISLLYWFPLNGDATNQGLHEVTTSLATGTTFDDSGKIGKCLVADNGTGTGHGVSVYTNLAEELITEYSVSVWVNPAGEHRNYEGAIISSGNWNSTAWAFGVRQDNTKIDVFSRWYERYITLPEALPTGEWTHIVSTMNSDGLAKVYINGEFVGQLSIPGYLQLRSNAEYFNIGKPTYTDSYGFNGKINDVRIYDHELQPQEIKLLSQALILHYPMGNVDGVIGGRNLIQESHQFNIYNNNSLPATLVTLSETYKGQKIFRLTMTPNESIINNFRSYAGDRGVSSKYRGYIFLANALYTNSIYWRPVTNPDTKVNLTASNIGLWRHVPTKSIGDGWYRTSATRVGTEQKTDGLFYSFYVPSAEVGVPITIDFTCPKLEVGELSAYTPAPEDYPDMYENIIYDTSGYQHNGTVTDATRPTWNNESPRYAGSYEFDGTKYIVVDSNLFYNGQVVDELTICGWAKCNDGWNSNDGVHIFSAGNSFIRISLGKANQAPWIYIIYETSSGSLRNLLVSNPTNPTTKEWYHISVTFDNPTIRVYLNGELVRYVDISDCVGLVCTTTDFVIGSGGRYYEPSIGNISDLRIYATALSPDEIMDLYKTSAYIDSSGNLISYGLEENDE